jgi:hypothetical protein
VPDYDIPEGGEYLWDWFCDLLTWADMVNSGVAVRLPPSEMLAWAKITGNVVNPDEYAILRDMNAAWAAAMNDELSYSRTVKAERDAAEAKGKGKR